MGLQKSCLQHRDASREVQSVSQETGLGTGTSREQLQQGLGHQAEGAWLGVPVRLVRAMKLCCCPQDNGNEDNRVRGGDMLPGTAELALLVHISQTFTDTVQWDKTSQRRVDRHRCGMKQEISIVAQDTGFSRQS